MFSKSWVPNGLTSMNLVFVMCSILFTFHGELEKAAICIFLALVADRLQLENFGVLGWVAAIFFAVCGMGRLARFNVSTDVVHGYFMGLAIPAGGCLIATSTLLFKGIGFDLNQLSYAYPVLVMVVGYLMVSTVHYPNFKGDGAEKMNLVAKAVAAVVFLAILYLGMDAIVSALMFAIFSSYDIFGIINHTIKMSGK